MVVIKLLLKDLHSLSIIGINIFICALWHFLIFVICITIDDSFFDYKKACYKQKKWENNGKWYDKTLKIKKWKNVIPQHIGKDGFSKRHFESLSIEYIDQFILETCRGEWNHKYCTIYSIIAIIISPFWYGLFLGLITFIFNLACIAIQRYNRIRLLKVKLRLTKDVTENNNLQYDSSL